MKDYATAKLACGLICILVFFSFYFPIGAHASSKNQRAQLQYEINGLKEEIEMTQSECNAIDSRLNAINKLMAKNYVELQEAEHEYLSQKQQLNERFREIYKNGDLGMLQVILNIKDFEDFLLRLSYLQKINASNLKLLDSYNDKRKKRACIRKDLEKTKLEGISLKTQKLQKLPQLENKLAEEQVLLDKANLQLKQQIHQEEEARKNRRLVARAQSAPLGSQVKIVNCNVFPYLSNVYLTSQRLPSNYKGTGIKFSGVASWYGNEFNGQSTASGEIFNENDFTCASKTLPFGTFLGVTYKDKHIVVKVTDRGPFVKGRILDLSKAAAKALGISGLGLVNAEILEPGE